MKKADSFIFIIAILAIFIFSCTDTKIGSVDLDFDVLLTKKQLITFVGKPTSIGINVDLADQGNNYPLETFIDYSDGEGELFIDGKRIKSKELIHFDYKTKGTLWIQFTPTKAQTLNILNITIKNQMVTKTVRCDIDCKELFFNVGINNLPDKVLIDSRADFKLLLSEMETSGETEVMASAKIVKGSGILYQGEQAISTIENNSENEKSNSDTIKSGNSSTRLLIGSNDLTYLGNEEGNNIIRLYLTNKWGYEITKDITIPISLPEWNLSNSMGNDYIEIPYQDNYSFNISVNEEDIFKNNEYSAFYRILSNTSLNLSINNKDYNQGESLPLKAGSNIGILNVKDASAGEIEFIVKDKYKQEHKDTLRFISKRPLKPIEASLLKSSQTSKINKPTIFKLTVKELNYNDVFNIEYEILSGSAIIEGGLKQSLSEGTHDIKITPTTSGYTTFKIKINDTNGQEKIVNATIQATLSPLSAILTSKELTIDQGQRGQTTLILNEEDYTGLYTLEYTSTGVLNEFNINNTNVSPGGKINFKEKTNQIYITGSSLGKAQYNIFISDEYGQEKKVTLYVTTTGKIKLFATEGGTVTGEGQFELDQMCIAEAAPKLGYKFLGWFKNGNLVSNQAIYKFPVKESLTLEARFECNKLTVTANASIGGNVTGGGTYEYGKNVNVLAEVKPGYIFMGWYNGAKKESSSLSYTFVLTEDITLIAQFAPKDYTIVVNAQIGGSVTGNGNYKFDTNATVTAKINSGYTFMGWYEENKKVSEALSYTFKVSGDRSLEARFSANKHNVTVNAQTGGTVTGSGTYEYGKMATVKATPGTNYIFEGWYEGSNKVSKSATYSFVVTKDIALEALFMFNKHKITLTGTNGTVTGGGTYNWGSNATISATPGANYIFEGWYEGNNKISASNPYIFKVEKDRIIEAKFELIKYNIMLTAGDGGTVKGGGVFDHGAIVAMVASPKSGYTFMGWYEGSTKLSGDLNYTFKAEKNLTILAKFKQNIYNYTVTSNIDNYFVDLTNNGNELQGNTVNLSANLINIPDNYKGIYIFDGWYDGETRISQSESMTIKMPSKDCNFIAKYKSTEYIVNCSGVCNEIGKAICKNWQKEIYKNPVLKFSLQQGQLEYDPSNSRSKVNIRYRDISAENDITILAKFTYLTNPCDNIISGAKTSKVFTISKGHVNSNTIPVPDNSSIVLFSDENENLTVGGKIIKIHPISGTKVIRYINIIKK